jgi:hypothetical protein
MVIRAEHEVPLAYFAITKERHVAGQLLPAVGANRGATRLGTAAASGGYYTL